MSDLATRLTAALAGRYRIERELGRGGMATVFLAEDLRHHRQVAIKVLDPEVAAAIGPERFLREIETVARLTHPHILPLHDSGAADGLLFYVMPYVEGESLRDRLAREKQLPVEEALRLTREVASGLEHAHRHGVVHRDVKPENILLQDGQALVADFGIARAVAAGGAKLTATGIAVGTPAYMSPEQAAGGRDLDGRSDLYSLGCVLYEMLAGQPPFTGPTAESLAHQHLNAAPRPVTELRPLVPAAVAAALQRALAKTPADRQSGTSQLAAELAGATTAERSAAAPTPVPTGKARHASRAAIIAAAAIVVLAVAAWVAVRSGWLPAPGKAHGGATTRAWILVADFDGPPEDPSLARTAREIVCATLDQSPVVGSYPRDQIQLALSGAGKPDSVRLTPQLAREIAYRNMVRTVLEGEIGRMGALFTLTVRATDVERDRQLFTLTDVAGSEDALVPRLTNMARRVREKLGESPTDLRTTRPDEWSVATPSFEAYHRWAEGMRLYNQADNMGALRLFREALATDPKFGVAWASLAFAYAGLGKPDSALAAFEEALRHPESLTPAYRLLTEGRVMSWRGDLRGASETYQRVERLYPGSVEARWAFNHESVIQTVQGRLAEALAAQRRSNEGFMEVPPGRAREASLLLALGQLPAARTTIRGLQGRLRQSADLSLALADHDWRRADGLASWLQGQPQVATPVMVEAIATRATVAAVRGELSAAEALLRQAGELQHEKGSPSLASRAGRGLVTLALASGQPVPRAAPWLERDTTTSGLITRAYMAAAAGDTSRARRLLAGIRSRPGTRLGANGSTPEFIEACIAARAGRWGDAIALIAVAAREGSDRGDALFDRIGVTPERLLVAQAYERLGEPDSAAAFYLRLLGPECSRSLDSFAHQSLVMIYARMGRREEAEMHWQAFSVVFTSPDPVVRHLLDEARTAIVGLRAMAPHRG